jgi:hypothetical protein
MHLKIAYYNRSTDRLLVHWEGEDLPPIGMSVTVLEQIAIETGFTYDLVLVGSPGLCSTVFYEIFGDECPEFFGPFFYKLVEHFDVVGPWWIKTVERQMTVDFSDSYVDTSIALFTISKTEDDAVDTTTAMGIFNRGSNIDWLSWAAPFTGKAWALIIMMCLVTGVSQYFFENGLHFKDKYSRCSTAHIRGGIWSAIKDSMAGLITGTVDTTKNQSTSGKLANISFTFVILVVLAGTFSCSHISYCVHLLTESVCPG